MHDGGFPRGRGCARALALALLPFAAASARDAYVVLSGGGTPLSNNYSQYLQTKEMSAYLRRTRPADSVWVFFGAGNRTGEPAALADVHRQVKEDGLLRDMWLPGALPLNRTASKEEFLRALGSEILPSVRGGGTLYLFVGDHGSQSKTGPRESVITMWQMVNRGGAGRGWDTDPSEVLRVSELREALAAGLGRGKVVFCMTQCYSGGFHYLGVPRDVSPDPAWFQAVPDWATGPAVDTPLPAAAGFTSADEDSIASGCDPDPDPDRWAGYDRFAPEALLGIDLESGTRAGDGQPSYAAAHEAAVMQDQTIDRPRSSSEQYLERWAQLIERLGSEPALTDAAREHVASYRRAVDRGLASAADPDFAARLDLYTRYVSRMCEQNPSAAGLLQGGTFSDLERATGMNSRSGHGGGRKGSGLWMEALRPAWKRAVQAGQVEGLAGDALVFERYLLTEEDKGREIMSRSGSKDPMLNELYWRSGYAFPSRLDEAKAEAVTRWGAQRRKRIIEWARSTTDPALRDAAETLAAHWLRNGPASGGPARTLPREIAAARTLFYRRVLAAWAFLMDMNEQEALSRLHQYIDLEQTPLSHASAYRG